MRKRVFGGCEVTQWVFSVCYENMGILQSHKTMAIVLTRKEKIKIFDLH